MLLLIPLFSPPSCIQKPNTPHPRRPTARTQVPLDLPPHVLAAHSQVLHALLDGLLRSTRDATLLKDLAALEQQLGEAAATAGRQQQQAGLSDEELEQLLQRLRAASVQPAPSDEPAASSGARARRASGRRPARAAARAQSSDESSTAEDSDSGRDEENEQRVSDELCFGAGLLCTPSMVQVLTMQRLACVWVWAHARPALLPAPPLHCRTTLHAMPRRPSTAWIRPAARARGALQWPATRCHSWHERLADSATRGSGEEGKGAESLQQAECKLMKCWDRLQFVNLTQLGRVLHSFHKRVCKRGGPGCCTD